MNRAAPLLVALIAGCAPEGRGLARTPLGTGATVKFDVFHRPLPEVPLPNDFATRFDPGSPTRRRLNASLAANTLWEQALRASIDRLDGWGTYQPSTVSFDKPLDLLNIVRRHVGDDYAPMDDVAYVIDVTPDSPDFCERVPLDLGEGNFPLVLERADYFLNDRPGENFAVEDREEDANKNGRLDLGEDLDMDGVLDHPNLLYPGASTFDAMTFYERETNTLIMRPLMPLREQTTYAVVLTRRLLDEDGRPVRSPFEYVNHASQTRALAPLGQCLPRFGLGLDEVAFTWAYTTQSITHDFRAIRDGLYGLGPMQRLAAEFPTDVTVVRVRDSQPGQAPFNVRLVPSVMFRAVIGDLLKTFDDSPTVSPRTQATIDSHRFVDFYAIITFDSPQFFPRADAEGRPLPLYLQTWDLDSLTGAAFVRPEKITALLTVPKRRNGPAPVAIFSHSYTSAKEEGPVLYGGFLARYGIASISIDAVSHGIPLGKVDRELAIGVLANKQLGAMGRGLLETGRVVDWNGDGVPDSGADFWTAYMPHTRDVVRQTAVDSMQLVRVIRSFDGTRRWQYDAIPAGATVADGRSDLAGDFDGDGTIDIGGAAPIHVLGGSLGGILSSLLAGLEPQLDIAIPIAGAAGLGDVGVRSVNPGVREAVNLRMMGPLLLGVPGTQGRTQVFQLLPDLNETGTAKLAEVPAAATPKEGDTVVLWNLGTEQKRQTSWWKSEYRCGRVDAGGRWRLGVPADEGDRLKLALYSGVLPPQAREGCRIPEEARPAWELDPVEADYFWPPCNPSRRDCAWTTTHAAGEPLIALGDGFGLRRQTPELRSYMNLAQTVLDSGDPINAMPFVERNRILRYRTGEEVSTRLLVLTTVGDMNVPVAAGASIARAAGFIDLFDKDPRYGATPNRVLIDRGTIEAVERVGRYQNAAGQNVHMDVENLPSISNTSDGFDVPRLDPPLRLISHSDRIGGYRGALFLMAEPTGRHAFDSPDPSKPFDIGTFVLNMLGRYAQTDGMELPLLPCNITSDCPWTPPIPPE